ncbi:MAG: ATP-binding cassette domain-containing protein [Planctomycetes bacterium]|nr:ATP-binding cassette domain-containing protein [Planctomycetota bacterium]
MNSTPALVLESLEAKRGGSLLFQDLCLHLPSESCGVVIGKNGSGKSTLSEIICGLRPWTSGTISKPDSIGYAPQDPLFPLDWTLKHAALQWAALGGAGSTLAQQHAHSALELFQLDALHQRTIRSLSRGWQQRLNLARAWLGTPQLLILDEPHTALDQEGMECLAHALNGQSALVLTPAGTPSAQLGSHLSTLGQAP